MIDETIRTALLQIVPDVMPVIYSGNETEYITYNYSEYPQDFGDNEPQHIKYLVQVHWFLPNLANPTKKKQIKQKLVEVGCTYPTVVNASDDVCQHYVLECEYVDGDV